MIDPELVSTICAECGFEEDDWEMVDDVTLLSAIEEKLKPHDAMDFTVQLRMIKFDSNAAKGTLMQRYRLFAEPFLAKVSEAKAASCQLPENVVKLTFSRAISGDPILQGWVEQHKWTSVGEVHRRITQQLKMVEAYNTLTSIAPTQRHVPLPVVEIPAQQATPQRTPPAQNGQQQHPHNVRNPRFNDPHFNGRLQAMVHNAMAAYQQGISHQQNRANGGAAQAAPAVGNMNAVQQERQFQALSPFPGLDARGPSWHLHSALLGCKQFPCNAPFCQACGLHHHTADECRKRIFKNPDINKSGYFSEQKPNSPPVRAPRPTGTANAAVQAQGFPVPFRMNPPAASTQQQQSNSAVNHAAQQPPAPNSDSAGSQDN
jgi:hypothetical protein